MANLNKSFLGGLSVYTSIRFTMDQLRQLNNISYLFNPSWDSMGKIRVGSNTLPMSLLYVTGLKEIGQSEVSSEQLLLYKGEESSTSNNANTTPQSVINVVADNIVNKPRQWQVDAIVPDAYDSLIGGAFKSSYINPIAKATLQRYNSGDDISDLVATTLAIPSGSLSILQLVTSLVSTLLPFFDSDKWSQIGDGSSLEGDLLTTIANGTTYNKDSIIDMWLGRNIIKFKPPMDWIYRTVVITSFDISKRPTEDHCHRLTMTLQEVPIMTTGFYTGVLKGIKSNDKLRGSSAPVKWVGQQLSYLLNKIGKEV